MKKTGLLWLVILASAATLAPNAGAGITYTVTTTNVGGKNADQADSVVKVWAEGDKARVEFQASKSPIMEKGTYLISEDGGKTTYLVNPEDKTYTKFDLEEMLTGTMGMAKGMMQMNFSEPKVEKLAEEAGPEMQGLPTTHSRFRISYTMSMQLMMMKMKSKIEKEEDIWATTKLGEEAMGIWLRKTPIQTGDENLDKLLKAEMEKVKGFPLKTVTVTKTTDEKGKTETTTATVLVSDIKTASVAASQFQLPAGYRETSLMEQMGGMEEQPRKK